MAPYTPIAKEYYDPLRHPTCANFDELSRRFLLPKIERLAAVVSSILEVGCGRSIAAPIIAAMRRPLNGVVLLDVSPAMLAHSHTWERHGARLVVADAQDNGLASSEFDLIVSSLGDPYNTPRFWREVHRLARAGATCLFTTPAPEWAAAYRSPELRSEAEFVIADGSAIAVPSYVPKLEEQVEMIEGAGLVVEDIQTYFNSDVSGTLSPKLLVPEQVGGPTPVMRGFVVSRQE